MTISASNDGTNFVLLDTLAITITATPTVYSDTGVDTAAWDYIQIVLSELTGTATINVYMAGDIF